MLLERNIFRRKNGEQLTGYYPAAVKIFNRLLGWPEKGQLTPGAFPARR